MKFVFGRPFPRLLRRRRRAPVPRKAGPRCRPILESLESREVPYCTSVYWPAPYNTLVGFPSMFGVCNTNDSGSGSLRDAINAVNSMPAGSYLIYISIPTPQVQQVHTIHLLSPLPPIHNSVFINAIALQLDYNPQIRQPMVELDGSHAGSITNGLVLNGDLNFVAGLTINNFGGSGLVLQNGIKDKIVANYIGTDATGTQSRPNNIGITVRNGAAQAKIVQNVISGNLQAGVLLTTSSVTRTVVRQNKIGTDYLGLNALPNRTDGVVINQGSSGNRLLFNLISGNIGAGVSIQDRTSEGNVIAGNHIGTNDAGTLPLPNHTGVLINQALGTTIGRPSGTVSQPGRRSLGNLISGNTVGINLISVQPNLALGEPGTIIRNNFIGTDLTGTLPLGNLQGGVVVQNSIGTTIGSTDTSFYNVIAANGYQGILLSGGTSRSLIEGNYIGTDVTGTNALSNTIGVYVQGGSNNTIGGTLPGAGNILSGNSAAGVTVVFSQSTGNVIQGNYIGTNPGVGAVSNGTGINIAQTATNTTIGGTAPGATNMIFYNSTNGISISDTATGTVVQGNLIFGNQANGVAISRASNNTIGGLAPGAINFMTSDGNDGVLVDTGTGNLIEGNSISGNAHLGIELIHGGNLSQAAPVITSAGTDTSQNVTTVTGTISGLANATYTVDFYVNVNLDPSGYGEGLFYLGTITVPTDASGHGIIMIDGSMVALAGAAPPGTYLTATATDPANNTSQFSAAVLVTDQTPSGGDGATDAGAASVSGAVPAVGTTTLAQALGTTLDQQPAVVVWQGATVLAPQPSGADQLPANLPALQGMGSVLSQPVQQTGAHQVLDSVFADSSTIPLDGTADDGLFHLGQSSADLG